MARKVLGCIEPRFLSRFATVSRAEEQYQIYRDVLKTFDGKPVVLRTLDVGGDKPLPYFPIAEDNPFLGWRGIRITLDHPEIFTTQLRAMLRASIGLENLQVLLPMITGVEELDEAKAIILRVRQEIQEEQNHRIKMPLIGAMIEVPSAVYQIDDICKRVDFVSIGGNDLTQYLLAVDRNNENVANLYSALHPAVLKAIYEVAKGAQRNQTAISVCGELAGDPLGVLALMGMGIDSLSMSVWVACCARKMILSFSMDEARSLSSRRLPCQTSRRSRSCIRSNWIFVVWVVSCGPASDHVFNHPGNQGYNILIGGRVLRQNLWIKTASPPPE